MSGKRQQIQYSLALEPVERGETPLGGSRGTARHIRVKAYLIPSRWRQASRCVAIERKHRGLELTSIGNSAAGMPIDLPLQCRCGYVRGAASKVAPSAGLRFVCYCRDCQAFSRFLDRSDVLDAAGGTDIFQMPTGRVK